MRIAILGWGSLVRSPGSLAIVGEWRTGGPILPIEFSRISDDGRLTLVIDEDVGVDVSTRYVMSSFEDLGLAIADLQKREKAPTDRGVGFVCAGEGPQAEHAVARHPKSLETIRTWLADRPIDAVLWTAIGPRFKEKVGEPFSVEAAVRYLKGLREPARSLAYAYIMAAPDDVSTPVRTRAKQLLDSSTA